jgi:uncharacterized protein
MEIDSAKLRRIESCEMIVKKIFDVKQVRVRDHGTIARIEVEKTEITKLCNIDAMDEMVFALKELGFKHVTLDLEGYREKDIGKQYDKEIITIDKHVRK